MCLGHIWHAHTKSLWLTPNSGLSDPGSERKIDLFLGLLQTWASAEMQWVEGPPLFQKNLALSAISEMPVIFSNSVTGSFTVGQWANRVYKVASAWFFPQLCSGWCMKFSRKCLCEFFTTQDPHGWIRNRNIRGFTSYSHLDFSGLIGSASKWIMHFTALPVVQLPSLKWTCHPSFLKQQFQLAAGINNISEI